MDIVWGYVLVFVLAALPFFEVIGVVPFAILSGLHPVTTAVIGFIGGSREGKRLAIAHILFNFTTGSLALILLQPLTYIVLYLGKQLDLDYLTQLAVFHTLFNVLGVSIFWQLQSW